MLPLILTLALPLALLLGRGRPVRVDPAVDGPVRLPTELAHMGTGRHRGAIFAASISESAMLEADLFAVRVVVVSAISSTSIDIYSTCRPILDRIGLRRLRHSVPRCRCCSLLGLLAGPWGVLELGRPLLTTAASTISTSSTALEDSQALLSVDPGGVPLVVALLFPDADFILERPLPILHSSDSFEASIEH